MNRFAVLALLVVAASARTVDDDLKLYDDFKATFGRTHSPGEDVYRFNCFRKNLVAIDRMNANAHDQATYGTNQFSDMCEADFKLYHNLQLNQNVTGPMEPLFSAADLAAVRGSSVDWRKKGAVTPIKNQGMCGSCWSFGCTGNFEGQWFLAGNKLVGLSEEELVQCDKIAAMGCSGAQNLIQSFEWIIQNGGIDSEADYPYTSGGGVTGTCNTMKTKKDVATLKSYVSVASNEDQMATWTAKNGPLQIGVDAQSWQSYSGGIMSNCDGRQLDHAVLVVGFDDNNSPPYWIIKNSWGTSWGENGYVRVEKGTNQCGLDSMPCSGKVH